MSKNIKEEPTNVTGPHVAGLDKDTVPGPTSFMKKIKCRDKFLNCRVFPVSSEDFNKATPGKKKYERMSKYISDLSSGVGQEIHTYANRYPKSGIIVQDERTKSMMFLRKPRN